MCDRCSVWGLHKDHEFILINEFSQQDKDYLETIFSEQYLEQA